MAIASLAEQLQQQLHVGGLVIHDQDVGRKNVNRQVHDHRPSGSLLLKEAHSHYLWQETTGTGSLSLSFETVFEKAKDADFWITSGQFSTLKSMIDANPHYNQFKAFQNKKVYSFSGKKGKTGGILYYELGPNRPDIVLKDLIVDQ